MKALDLLLNRVSIPRLQAPAPKGDELDNILKAGMRVPDHASLAPFRFIICEGEGREKLGDLFKQVAVKSGLSDSDISRAPELPMRAPMVIVAITNYKEHPKVPRVEQICTTACAVHAMQMAAVAQSFAGIWRTGSYATNPLMKEALSLNKDDEIVGFLYLGTASDFKVNKPTRDFEPYIERWS